MIMCDPYVGKYVEGGSGCLFKSSWYSPHETQGSHENLRVVSRLLEIQTRYFVNISLEHCVNVLSNN
jgi:hypothetical protein